MKFNSSNNNSRDAVNVNTRGMQFSNSEGFCPSTLLFGYWNELISIKIHPALEKSQQTDSKRFNYEEVVNTAITLEKASTLLKKIEEDILPHYNEGINTFKGIPVGGDSLIGVGLRSDENTKTSYLAIFKALDEETKKPEIAIYYEFKSGYVVNDYDPATGKFTVEQNIPSELMLFAAALRAAINGLTHADAHSSRAVDKWFRDRLMKEIEEIGTKLGVAPKTKGNWGNGGGNYKSKDIFAGGGNSNSSDAGDLDGGDASIDKLSNIDDINQFMM
jgi:hypothetical protein